MTTCGQEILTYNTEKDIWEVFGKLPYGTPVTTLAFKWGQELLIPGGEIKAGVRSPYILMANLFYFAK